MSGSKRLFVFILALCWGEGLFAQGEDPLFDSPLSDSTREGLSTTFETIRSQPLLRADFLQKRRVKNLNKIFVSEGTFLFQREVGIAWLSKIPFESLMLITKNEIIERIEGEEIRIDLSSQESLAEVATMIQALFEGDISTLSKQYDLFYRPLTKNRWEVGFIPREGDLFDFIRSIKISGGETLSSFRLEETSGNSIEYNFSNVEFPDQLSSDEKALFS